MSKIRKDNKGLDFVRPFKLAHQTLCITGFNFETESIVGYVELLIHPLKPDLKKVKINSKQCRIYRVSINEVWETSFSYNDPTLEICQGDIKNRNLDLFETCQYNAMIAVDCDHGNGELTIKVPPEASTLVAEMKPFRICIEFSLEQPKGGIKFVVPDMDGTMLDRGAHVFTYRHENSSRLWFPCVDSYSEVCTWKLEYTVDMYMTAVSCGDLIETVYTADLRKKTYHYYLSTPTSAPNIGLAVGPFEVLVDPHMHEVTHFCLPHLMPVLRHSTTSLHESFEFLEELLSSRSPYGCYKQVFVDQAYQNCTSYASMTVFNTNILHTKRVIDQVPRTRLTMAQGVAEQFFGCFITINSWSDAWLPKGIAGYLTSLYMRRTFGNNEYRHFIAEELDKVQQYELTHGGIVLDPSANKEVAHYFNPRHPHCVSPHYAEMYEKKAVLVLRMLEIRIGREQILQVFNKMLSLATVAAQQKVTSYTWINMLLSTTSFLKLISSVTGKDVHMFMDQWVRSSGCARFVGSFVFNRKRNVVELDLKQDMSARGTLRYVGPLTVSIQELDGTFNHTFQIEENKTKFEITCHSKSRRHKKKKIPLCTGEEVDMDLNDMDADSPVLWLRVDPEMTTLRHVKLEQPDYMWHYMLRYERDVTGQARAITALGGFPTPKTRLALTDVIENDKCYYKVRMQAAYCLAKVANQMATMWAGPPAMMTIFRKFFGSHSCSTIPRQNNFNNFQRYYLQKTLPSAMATLRNMHGLCPSEVLTFLLDLFKYNDNNKNKWSDNYYRSELIDALALTLTPAVTTVTITGMCPSTDSLTADTKLILEEITRALNMEKLLPCYRNTVTVSCLAAIRKLQKFGHLPSDPAIFKSYAREGNFVDVRLAALNSLVDYTKVECSREILWWLLDLVESDPNPYVRNQVIQMMIENPMFQRREENMLNTESLVNRLWNMMNKISHDSRLRCNLADLYFTLYGRTRPTCLPLPDSVMVMNMKDKRMSTSSYASRDPGPMLVVDDLDTRPSHSFDDMVSRPMTTYQPPMNFMEEDSNHGVPPATTGKRRASSPMDQTPFDMRRSSVDMDMKGETIMSDDSSQFKLKIRIGSQSPSSSHQNSPATLPRRPSSPSPSSGPSSPGTITAAQYSAEFHRFAGMMPSPGLAPPPVPSVPMPPKPTMSIMSETVSVSTKYDREASRLSEDSDSNSLPGAPMQEMASAGTAMDSPAPTSFHSSMFPGGSSLLRPGVPLPPTPPTASDPNKPHKAKKTKKKKKKHKHKHKHEKGDKGERREVLPPDFAAFSMDHASSGRSNTNSPHTMHAPDSPEFEVM